MEAIQFINNYQYFIDEIRLVVKPELIPILDELQQIDPHDLVRPEEYFESEIQSRGFVWAMFIKRALYKS